MINEEQIKKARELLDKAENPVIFFDDDPDGLCSFSLIYRYLGKGHGVIVKNSPCLTKDIYAKKANEYNPDLIVILDKPKVEDEFMNEFSCPILWIDHHEIQETHKNNIYYFNPLQNSKISSPTTYQAWKIVEEKQIEKDNQDLWIAITGIAGDWFFPEDNLLTIAKAKWPNLIPKELKIAPDLMFIRGSGVGKLIKTIRFNLKGKMKDVQKAFKIFTRIESPMEILDQTTPQGKYLYKNFRSINEPYMTLLKNACGMKDETQFLVAILHQEKYSFSSELSNEVFYKNPEKIVVVGRSSGGYTKGSLRTSFEINLNEIVQVAVAGLDGYSGGHPKACGFKMNDNDFDIFLDRFKEGCLSALVELKK